jgi:hypothetical protein
MPGMLVAIGHMVQAQNVIDALEIGDELLPSTSVTESHVRSCAHDVPVVLLLGCGTMYDDQALGNFVSQFSYYGAGLIVATIASILTMQADLCVESIARAFEDARMMDKAGRERGDSTAGFAVLRAKQILMTTGSGLALTLTGAGDSEWQF